MEASVLQLQVKAGASVRWAQALMAPGDYAERCLSDINVFFICQATSKKRRKGAGKGRVAFQE